MEIKPIKTKRDYATALKEIERLYDAKPGTAEGDRLEVLTVLIHVYEEKHHAVPLPNPIDAIQYYMESRGLTRRDLEKYIGSRARVSEVLNRKRPITMDMIRNLHRGLGIPAEVLIQPYRTVRDAA
jgi:HTH-type transcriptional regulator/antitoxin HigA